MEDFTHTDGPGKVIRAPSLKRGKPEERITDRIKLEKVLGVTVSSNAALSSDGHGSIAYPAGCTAVLFNTKTEQQNHIINTSRKTITSLAYSLCGRYLVTGECGHQPAVRVWDLLSDPQSGQPGLAPQPQQIAEFLGHKYGINCVAFSPTNKFVVSVGTQHDMIVNVWDWKNNIKVASNKVSTKVKAIAFADNGSYFVTVGNRHVKFWYLDHGKSKIKEAVPLMGRSAILGEQRNNYFCDVACGKDECGDSTYAITRSGLLCEFNNRRLLDKWVELRTESANCITVGEKYIFVGCAEGIVRCFDPRTLSFLTTLPRTHYLGVDVSLGSNITHMASKPPNAKYPDTVAITYDEPNNKLTSVYNDHSVYVWDVFNIKRVGKSHSFLYHSACIWGVEMAPPNSPFPPGSFLTCSSDDTIRVWTLDRLNDNTTRGMYKGNIYSNELLKVVYVDKDLSYIKDLDISATNATEKQETTSYDGRNGVRCIRVSSDGKNLASGDRSGNIRIHETASMREMCKIEAHDAEVLCLEYSGEESKNDFMASASRDRLLHVFDVKHGYEFLQTLDDHSSSITAVRFLNHSNNIQMVSCGADKSIIFRTLSNSNKKPQFVRDHHAMGKTTLYDMEVDTGQKHILTACQDRNVRIYSVNSGKHTKSFKGSTGDDGTLIKVVLDRSGIYLATSCTDKSLSVYDYYSGECMATMCGHSELATGLRFTNDCRRLVSASGDGCIFVWRVPHDMVITMHARLSQQAMRQGKTLDNEIFADKNPDFGDGNTNNVDSNYSFNIGQMPNWAKKQLTEDTSQPPSLTKGVAAPKGRWAQRAENTMGVKTFYSNNPLPFPSLERRFDSDGSKDSSLDSGTEQKVYSETTSEVSTKKVTIRTESRRCTMTDDSKFGDTGFESAAHDGDVDSDNEYRHRPLYYPTQSDSPSGSEFTVTNIDADELRKSQRKKKTKPNLPQVLIQSSPTFGSQDSDDDDDEASTPSGENTDRNPMSLLSVSTESLDQLVNREKYLQSTFESMSGAENELTPGKTSISSKFLTRSGDRNVAAINAVMQTKTDPEANKKRVELNKRIAETKKKLESVGHSSPLKYSQSIHDLSHIPERDKWNKSKQNSGNTQSQIVAPESCFCAQNINQNEFLKYSNDNNMSQFTNPTNTINDITLKYYEENPLPLPMSLSVPSDLQLCGCYMKDITKNTTQLSHFLNLTCGNTAYLPNTTATLESSQTHDKEVISGAVKLTDLVQKSPEKTLSDLIRPRKLKLDKTLTKYKLHKSLPVSPVSEERQFSDYVTQKTNKTQDESSMRKSFSYFIDLESKETDEGFKQICSDIEKFSEDFNRKYEQIEQHFQSSSPRKPKIIEQKKVSKPITIPISKIQQINDEEEANFSSDSLEDYSFLSIGNKKRKNIIPPRRCVSNNELYEYQLEECEIEIPKSESFYLNQHIHNSQDSILSDENQLDDDSVGNAKSYCNSMESILSNDSDCKSAPLEALFAPHRKPKTSTSYDSCLTYSSSLPKSIISHFDEYNVNSNLPKEYDNSAYHGISLADTKQDVKRSQSMYVPHTSYTENKNLKTSQTQTDFATPEEIVAKKSTASVDFQKKLLKFETSIAKNELHSSRKKAIAFFVDTYNSKSKNIKIKDSKSEQENIPVKLNMKSTVVKKHDKHPIQKSEMYIPSLESKNKQYQSRFCNVLNNKPEFNIEIFESGQKSDTTKNSAFLTLTNINIEKTKNKQHLQETSSLDRHLFAKSIITEKVCHKPPKAVRRHSSKNRKTKTSYEYVKKEDFYSIKSNKKRDMLNNRKQDYVTNENTIELNYKEKNIERDLEGINKSEGTSSNTILSELYDSLDKTIFTSKIDHDSLEVNLHTEEPEHKMYDSLEVDSKNVWSRNNDAISKNINDFANIKVDNSLRKQYNFNSSSSHVFDEGKIQFALENIKILNEIQRKIHKINNLVDVFKKNMCLGKVRALSSMYESMTNSQSFYNDLTKLQVAPSKYRRRNLSLPSFVERRLNYEPNIQKNLLQSNKNVCAGNGTEVKNVNVTKLSTEIIMKSPTKSNVEDTEEAADNNTKVYLDDSSPDSSLRRSCSLSDLSMQAPLATGNKRKVTEVSGKKNPTPAARSNSRYTKNIMTRSRSSGVLNQSDSDNDNQDKKMSRLMRPTISSHNKINKNLQSRKKQSYSTSNLNTVGVENVSTSDEEVEAPIKPAIPPRSRLTYENGPTVTRRHLNNKDKSKASRHTIHFDLSSKTDLDSTLTNDDFDLSIDNIDLSSVEMSNQLCDDVIAQLTNAAEKVIDVYNQLHDTDTEPETIELNAQKMNMVKRLEMSIVKTHKSLSDCIFKKLKQNNGNVDVNQTDTVKKLNDLVCKGSSHPNSIVNMMEQYSEILLDMVQQKIHNSNI